MNAALAEQATALALELQLGLLSGNGQLQHCALTLVPWQLSQSQWLQAQAVAQAVGVRMAALAQNDDALAQALRPVLAGESLPSQLWRALQKIPQAQRKAHPVNMMRIDLLLNQDQHWKLVEANTIAAGMGPFSEGLITLQQTLWPSLQRAGWVEEAPLWLQNPISDALADALIAGAQVASSPAAPHAMTVGFVVEPHEDNIFDQRKIEIALQKKGVRVVRLTLPQLAANWDRNVTSELHVQGIGRIDALYFRTGYNLADYRDHQGNPAALLQMRAELETLPIALAPTIGLQLASAKVVQVTWSRNSALDEGHRALNTAHHLVDEDAVASIRNWDDWILKSQGEGGGNVLSGDIIPEHLRQLSRSERGDWLLMQRIPTLARQTLVPVLRHGRIQMAQQLISELGVFLTGAQLHPAGYLLRSKPQQVLEAGVHRGAGAIDTINIKS